MTFSPLHHRTGARIHRTLSFRLVFIFVVLMTIVVSLISFVTITMLQRFLVRNLDDDLVTSGRIVAQTYINLGNSAQNPLPQANNSDDVNLSDYFLYMVLDGPLSGSKEVQKVRPSVEQSHGIPDNKRGLLSTIKTVPTTVAGTSGEPWRAVVMPIFAKDQPDVQIGAILVARPLGTILGTVAEMSRWLALVGLGVVTTGALTTLMLVHRSLRPLRNIESATHKIAAGDLSQRVPRGQDGTEVSMLADSINAMLAQIEQAFAVRVRSERKMRQFVSDASHELRTPLATVRGYAELYRLGGVPETEVQPAMDRIESEAKRMTGLVEDLLQLARLDEGRPLELTSVNITEICRNAVSDYHARAASHTATLVGLDGGEPHDLTIVADKDKVTQVVSNLLSNVLTHTPDGTPCEVAVGQPHPGEAVIEVRDHGPGVKTEDADRLFERFYRTDYSRNRASGGSGLGMAIVAAIMASHGGTARVAQTPGGGLTVRLTFPAAHPVMPDSAPTAQTTGR